MVMAILLIKGNPIQMIKAFPALANEPLRRKKGKGLKWPQPQLFEPITA
jgi:hypothetical protein